MKNIKIKFLLFGLFSSLLLFGLLPVQAATPNSSWSLTDYTNSMADATIPLSGSGGPLEPPAGADNYYIDLYERPTIQRPDSTKPADYYGFIDIEAIMWGEDANFYYFAIDVVNTLDGDLPEYYGVEIDFDKDGRGDYFLEVQSPKDSLHKAGWTTKALSLWYDSNNDVGKSDPYAPDSHANSAPNGYDREYWKEGSSSYGAPSDQAYVRCLSSSPTVVEFAIKKGTIGDFMSADFRGWAMKGSKNLDECYWHDKYTESQAGSPYKSSAYYPPGNIYETDNTPWKTNDLTVVPEASSIVLMLTLITATGIYYTMRKKPSTNFS